MDEKTIARFWAKVDRRGPDECWEWRGTRRNKRYGGFSLNRIPSLAHRVSWQIASGDIPSGMRVLHRCDNPPCVNPNHLFLGTQNDNMADMKAKCRGNGPCADDNHNSKLTTETAALVRTIYSRKEASQRQLAKRFGVTQRAIWGVIHGKTWKASKCIASV